MKDLGIDMIKDYIGTIRRGYEWNWVRKINIRSKNMNINILQKLLYIPTDVHPPTHTHLQELSKQKVAF